MEAFLQYLPKQLPVWRWTVRSCTSLELLCGGIHRDCCRPRGPAGYFLRSSRGSIRFSPDGRLQQTPSLIRTAAWDERYIGVDEGCVLSTPCSAEGTHASLSVQWRRRGVLAAKHPPSSGIAAPPPKRQCQAEFQATVLTHMEDFAGRLVALEVSGAPVPTPCSSSPAMLGIPAASRKTSSPALHEARILLGAGAGISRIRLPVKPARAVH